MGLFLFIAIFVTTLVFQVQSNHRKFPEFYDVRKRAFKNRFSKESKLFWKGMNYYCNGFFDAALKFFDEINDSKLSQKNLAELEFIRARCFHMTGYISKALRYYENALRNGYNDKSIYVFMGRAKEQNGNFSDAVMTYGELIRKGSVPDYVYTDIGFAYVKKGDAGKAIEAFNRSAEREINSAAALGGIALAYLIAGDFDKSKEYCQKAEESYRSMDYYSHRRDLDDYKDYYDDVKQAAELKFSFDRNEKKDAMTEI